jgi:glycosyltransferase involved in cell wall biosynthesis
MGLPKVSIIMPMYNAQRYVKEAIESILSQSGVTFELIIVDNLSVDGSVDIVESYDDSRIKFIRAHKRGVSYAFNEGLKMARGEIITRCDSDDLYAKNRLRIQVDFLESNPDFGAICGIFTAINDKGKLIASLTCYGEKPCDITDKLRNGILGTAFVTFAIRNRFLRELNGSRTFFVSAEDIDMQLRLSNICRIWYEPKNFYFYRMHEASITHSQHSGERKFFENLAKTLQQQRQKGGKDSLDLGEPVSLPSYRLHKPKKALDQINDILTGEVWKYYQNKKRILAVLTAIKICINQPIKISRWKNLLILIIKLVAQR